MRSRAWRSMIAAVLSVALVNMGFVSVAGAGIADTAALVTSSRDADLASIRAQLQRAEVRQQLEAMGVDAASVEARIAMLGDQELHRLAQDLQNAPAGGDLLAVLGVVFVVLMVLEFVGVIDIFKKT